VKRWIISMRGNDVIISAMIIFKGTNPPPLSSNYSCLGSLRSLIWAIGYTSFSSL
jgi:hypothetical protein